MTESTKIADALEIFAALSTRQRARVTGAVRGLLFPTVERVCELIRSESVKGDYKMCSTCRQVGPLATCFYRDRTKPDGYKYDCIACTHEKRGKKRRAKAA